MNSVYPISVIADMEDNSNRATYRTIVYLDDSSDALILNKAFLMSDGTLEVHSGANKKITTYEYMLYNEDEQKELLSSSCVYSLDKWRATIQNKFGQPIVEIKNIKTNN